MPVGKSIKNNTTPIASDTPAHAITEEATFINLVFLTINATINNEAIDAARPTIKYFI